MNILVLGDGSNAPYHPLKNMIRGIYSALHEKAVLTIDTDYIKRPLSDLQGYDAVINYIDREFDWEGYDDVLAEYIFSGGRVLALHNGIISPENSRLETVLGGNFITHPPYCELRYYKNGEELFTISEEAYIVRQTDERNRIFLEVEYEGRRYPAGWYRRSGQGFAAFLAPGHDASTGDLECFQDLLRETVEELLVLQE